jgi:hypothetical protein
MFIKLNYLKFEACVLKLFSHILRACKGKGYPTKYHDGIERVRDIASHFLLARTVES